MKKIVLLVVFYFLLMSTCNSQQGWFVSCSSQSLGTLRDIFFIDSLTGWITQDEGKLIKTTDGGFSWVQYNSGSVYDLNAIKFINALTGWAAREVRLNMRTPLFGITPSLLKQLMVE